MIRIVRLALIGVALAGVPGLAAQVPDPTPTPDTSTTRPARQTRPTRESTPPRELPPPAPGEERVTEIEPDDAPCHGFRRDAGFRLGENQVIRKGEEIDDFAVVRGDVLVEGRVCGDLSVTLGDVRLASGSSVEGTLVVVAGTATIEPGATVGGELILVAGTLDAPADFRPGRQQVVVGLPMVGSNLRAAVPYVLRGPLLGRLIVPDVTWVWGVVGVFFFVQLLINLLFPQATWTATRMIAERPLSTFLAGLLTIVLTGPVVTLLAVTVIGIAALPVLAGALVVAWIVGKIAVQRWIGSRVFEQDDPDSRMQSTRSFVIGFAVLTLLYMVPVLGLVVWGLTGVLGLGAAAVAFVKGYRRENPPPVRATPEPPPMPPAGPPAGSSGPGDPELLLNRAAASDPFTMPPPAYAGGGPSVSQAIPGATADPRVLLAYPRASFGERAAAFALDTVLVALIVAMLGVHEPSDVIGPLLIAYHVAFWTWKATTLGGIICQLRVVRVDGAPLRFVDTLVRGLVGVFSLATFGLGALWILRDAERQAWHDKVAGTFVVRVPRDYPLP